MSPADEEFARNWPRFRGAYGLGIAPPGDYPTEWDGAEGTNIAWSTEIPLPGKSSPIVWKDRVFLTGATEDTRQVCAFDAKTGAMVWCKSVENELSAEDEPPHVESDTGYAAPTMATDGERVFASFANGDVAAFSFDGEQLWTRAMGPLESMYGHAASLATYKDRVIVLLDQGEADGGMSSLSALSAEDGRRVWETERETGGSWSSPLVIEHAGKAQIITAANPWVISYDAETGKEIWRADVLFGDVAPSPIFAHGLVIACSDGTDLIAIRPDGQGDVTESHVAWRSPGTMPDTASPASDGMNVYVVASFGLMSCYRLSDGKQLWEQELPDGMYYSSPTIVGDQVWVMNRDGVMHFFATGSVPQHLGSASLGEKSDSTPAFTDGSIFIRGEKKLYRIGAPANGGNGANGGRNGNGGARPAPGPSPFDASPASQDGDQAPRRASNPAMLPVRRRRGAPEMDDDDGAEPKDWGH